MEIFIFFWLILTKKTKAEKRNQFVFLIEKSPDCKHAIKAVSDLLIKIRILIVVSEILSESIGQAFLPRRSRFEFAEEETQNIRFFDKLKSAHQVTVVVQPNNSVNGIIDLR